MRTFKQRREALDRLGWKVTVATEYRGTPPNREQHDLDLFSHVRLPLTARDWVRLIVPDNAGPPEALIVDARGQDGEALYERSEYVGWEEGKEAQRAVLGWLLDGGGTSVADLVTVGELMRDHFGNDPEENSFADRSPEELAEVVELTARENRDDLTAWGKIALLYHLVKDHYTPEVPEAQHANRTDLDAAFHTVGHMSWAFGVRDLFTAPVAETQENATLLVRMARFIPALRTVHQRIDEIFCGPVEGWALVDLHAGPGEIAENGNGLCVFSTRAECERLMDLWRQMQHEYEDDVCTPPRLRGTPVDQRIGIRPVRISLETGIEFLDDGAPPAQRPARKAERRPHWLREDVEDPHMLFDQFFKGTVWKDRERYPDAYEAALQAWLEAAQFFGRTR